MNEPLHYQNIYGLEVYFFDYDRQRQERLERFRGEIVCHLRSLMDQEQFSIKGEGVILPSDDFRLENDHHSIHFSFQRTDPAKGSLSIPQLQETITSIVAAIAQRLGVAEEILSIEFRRDTSMEMAVNQEWAEVNLPSVKMDFDDIVD